MKKINKLVEGWSSRLCSLLLCACFAFELFANSEVEVPKYLMIWNKDGGCVSFALSENPCIKYDIKNSKIYCVTSQQEVSFSLNEVHKYTLSNLSDEELGISGVEVDQGHFHQHAQMLYFEHFEPNSPVKVYDMSGALVAAHTVDSDGRLSFSIASWNPGGYVIQTVGASYKIVKK